MAFPLIGSVQVGIKKTLQGDRPEFMNVLQGGMELRDYFAAKAMAVIGDDRFIMVAKFQSDPLCIHCERTIEFHTKGHCLVSHLPAGSSFQAPAPELSDEVIQNSAKLCYQVADAMIKARAL